VSHPLRGIRTGLACSWHGGGDVFRATWCPWGGRPFDLTVRREGSRWAATVERVWPRLRREVRDDTRDEAMLWCEEAAWGIACAERSEAAGTRRETEER